MSVKARVIAGLVSFLHTQLADGVLTAYLHLAPQLRLALLVLLLLTGTGRFYGCFRSAFCGRDTALALGHDLASMNIAVCLY
jgi:hypothetical protein